MKLKKISIYIMLSLIMISSAIAVFQCDFYGQHSARKQFFFRPIDCAYRSGEPITSIFALTLKATDQDLALFPSPDLYDQCGRPENTQTPPFYYYYGDVNTPENELPFYIYSCKVKCDVTLPQYNYFWYMPTAEYNSSNFPQYTSKTSRFQTYSTCEYDDRYANKSVTQEISCTLVSNPDYVGTINPLCQLGYGEPVGEWGNDFIDEWTNSYIDYNCRTDIINNVTQIACTERYRVEFYIGEGNGGGFTDYNITINNVSQIQDPNQTTSSPPGSRVTPPTDTDINGDVGSPGNEQDDRGLRKQIYFDNQVKNIKNKNNFILGLILIAEVIFSMILLVFYILEIFITVYVISIWFPKMLRFPIQFFKEMMKKW